MHVNNNNNACKLSTTLPAAVVTNFTASEYCPGPWAGRTKKSPILPSNERERGEREM